MSFYTCFDWFKKLRLFVNEQNLRIDIVLKTSRAVVIMCFSLNEAPLGLFIFISDYLPYFEKYFFIFISWRSVLLVEETGVPGKNHRSAASHWQTLSHNVVSSTPRLSGMRTHNYSGDHPAHPDSSVHHYHVYISMNCFVKKNTCEWGMSFYSCVEDTYMIVSFQ